MKLNRRDFVLFNAGTYLENTLKGYMQLVAYIKTLAAIFTGQMGLFDWFSKKENTNVDIRQFLKLDGDSRLRRIMEWGDKGDDSKLKVFQYAILTDSDSGVKMAALKRIHLFRDKENVRQFLNDERTKNIGQTCEPYYSMALSRTGIISIEEFEKKVNK